MTIMTRLLTLLTLLIALALPRGAAEAQSGFEGNPFAPVVTVNGKGITGFELSQRMRFMQLLRAPGDLRVEAEKALIEDRLRLSIADSMGIRVSEDGLQEGMAEFAGRANMAPELFIEALAQAGVEAQTFRDFIRAGMAWRAVVREKYAGRITITEAEIDRAMMPESERGQGTRVLISEIIIPAPPGQEDRAMAIAREASALRGEDAFAAKARRVSATPSRGRGGRLDWMPLENLPPALRPIILGLAPGQASQPLTLPNAVAVFMLRAISDGGSYDEAPQQLDYMEFIVGPSGQQATLTEAVRVADRVDRCNDLYGVADGLPPERLIVESQPQSAIPQDIAVALASMDIGETKLMTRGANDVLVMLCARQRVLGEEDTAPSRDEVRERLTTERLAGYAESFFADEMSKAVITTP